MYVFQTKFNDLARNLFFEKSKKCGGTAFGGHAVHFCGVLEASLVHPQGPYRLPKLQVS
jgi:hypothetical protein